MKLTIISKIFIFLTFIPASHAVAQTETIPGHIFYNLNIHSGTVLPHHPSLAYLNRDYARSVEFNIWFDNPQYSKKYNSLPGAGYFFSSLGNNDVYGNLHAAYLNILNPNILGKLPVQFNIGVGLGYATKRFDIDDNYLNRAIGSHLNAYGRFSLSGEFPLVNDRWIFRPGISFHHMSNGAVVAPNQGLNLLTLHAGIGLRTGHEYPGRPTSDLDTLQRKRHRLAVIYAPGIKQMDRRIDKQIFTSSFIIDYGYRFNNSASAGVGLNFFYNDTWAYIPYVRTEKNQEISPFQSSLHLSLQLNRGPLAFIFHPGVYIYNEALEKTSMANRLGLKYSFTNNLTLQFAIKSHWFAIADYVEWGFGYEINR